MGKYDDLLRAVAGNAPPPKYVRAGGYYAGEPAHDAKWQEFLRLAGQAPPPDEGMTRLYRVGEISTNWKPPKTVKESGMEIPYDDYITQREMRMAGTWNPNPRGAAGRWATDDPSQLDFYINDNYAAAPVYRFDVPTASLPEYNVRNTPFSANSRNHEREFVLPDEYLQRAVRLLSPMGAAPTFFERD